MKRISDLVADGATGAEVQRVRRTDKPLTWGAYVPQGLTPEQEYLAKCHAVMARLDPAAALAGPSAAFVYELPLVGGVPSEVFVRNIARGRYAGDVQVMPDGPCAEHRNFRLSAPEATVLDCARVLTARDALIVADAMLASGLCSVDGLRSAADEMVGRHGASRMRWVAASADPLAESPGETWTRMLANGLGYDLISQVEVRNGERAARLDFVIEGTRIAVEFDGAIKYKRKGEIKVILQLLRDGDLQELGYQVLHVVWQQLTRPAQLDARFRYAGAVPVRRPRMPSW